MTISNNQERFFGKAVVEYRAGGAVKGMDVVYRLAQDYDDELSQQDLLAEFLGKVDSSRLDALVIGAWANGPEESPQGYLDALAERSRDLPALRALFVGDITYEENEMSWIIQGDYSGVLKAFPKLEVLRIRGTEKLTLAPFRHEHLVELAIESGGLPSAIVSHLGRSELPALRHLELWLGDDGYGFDGTLRTYTDLLAAIHPERLRYLGLRNAMIADELAVWLAGQPWLAKLDTLDLSMGTLGDIGAKALAASPSVRGLKRLVLAHHYIGSELQRQLEALPLAVDLSDPEEEDDGARFVAVSE